MVVPIIFRLYWWRFNGGGFACGVVCGMAAAVVQRLWMPDLGTQYQFLFIAGLGLFASVTGALLTQPTDPGVLRHFYRTTRPFGFWSHLKQELPDDVRRQVTREHRRDLTAVPFALVFQIMIFLAPMLLVIRNWQAFGAIVVIGSGAFLGLYYIWLRHISDPAPTMPASVEPPQT